MEISPQGIHIGNHRVPLWSGEVQFWRMDPTNWRKALEQVKRLGLPIVATYLSWRRHELRPGEYDFDGHSDPRLNVVGFLQLCQQFGLYVHLKPGPWICAEEPAGGYPDWLVNTPGIEVLDANNQPVKGYNPPFQSPIPCLVHPVYLSAVERWMQAVGEVIRPFIYPYGPVLLIQLDNEPSLTFHDRMFESDYNPVIVGEDGCYQRWLAETGRSPDSFPPPRSLEVKHWNDLRRYFDWAEYKEWLLTSHIETLRAFHIQNGISNVIFTTNVNEHEELSTPNQWHDLSRASGLVGYDYYFIPPFQPRDLINVAMSVNYSLTVAPLAWAPEMMAGIWISPGVDEEHPGFTLTDLEFFQRLGLAFGLKGINFYMAVNRENWESAPIQENGEPGDTYETVDRILHLVQRIPDFYSLEPVRDVAVLVDPMAAREAFISSEKTVDLEDYRLGSAYHRFYDVYSRLVLLNYNPALIDIRCNAQELDHYRVIFVPASHYLGKDVEMKLTAAAETGVKVVFMDEFPRLDDHFHPRLNPFDDARSDLPMGRGEWQLIQSEHIREYLDQIGLPPIVKPDQADTLAIIQKDQGLEVLFAANTSLIPVRTCLSFRDIESGLLVSVGHENESRQIKYFRTCLSLPPRSVKTFLIQR